MLFSHHINRIFCCYYKRFTFLLEIPPFLPCPYLFVGNLVSLSLFFHHIDSILLKKFAISPSAFFWYFINARNARYLVNAFIFHIVYHTQSPHYYWHDGTFKLLRFFPYFIIIFYWYIIICWHCVISIRRHVFFLSFIVLYDLIFGLLLFIFIPVWIAKF